MAKRTFFIETFGCQMNVHDSERMAGLLVADGYEPAACAEQADVVVVNTCSVRERAEDKLFSRLGELKPADGDRRQIIAVAGCVAQQEGGALRARAPHVDVVVGTQAVKQLPLLLRQADDHDMPVIDVTAYDDVSFPLGTARRGDPVKAYVTIIEGCNDYCAFCVVPYTRGHERMRRAADIVAEVEEAVAGGRKEVQLLGQIVNHYQDPDDASCDFARLLEQVNDVAGLERIRFASPHPRHASERLLGAIRDLPKVCKHLHLPLQSGSTRILTAMRRRHTRDDYLRLVEKARAAVPGLTLSTDLIVGFCGETIEDFEQTLALVQQVRYHSIFSFKYSPRPNTLASLRMPDDVSEEEKGRRLAVLQDVQREIQRELHAQAVGHAVEVLVDGPSRRRAAEMSGRTIGNTVVNFPGDGRLLGQLVTVRIARAGTNSLWGELQPPA